MSGRKHEKEHKEERKREAMRVHSERGADCISHKHNKISTFSCTFRTAWHRNGCGFTIINEYYLFVFWLFIPLNKTSIWSIVGFIHLHFLSIKCNLLSMLSLSFCLSFVSCFVKFSISFSHHIVFSSIDLSRVLSISFSHQKWSVQSSAKASRLLFKCKFTKKTATIKMDLNKLEIILKESSGSASCALHWYKNEIDS